MYDKQGLLRDWGKSRMCASTLCCPPSASQLEKCAAIGQLSCRDACQAYRSVTNQPEKLQQEHLPLFLDALSLYRDHSRGLRR